MKIIYIYIIFSTLFSFSFFLFTGTLKCWGSNSHGEIQHPKGYQFIQISASSEHHTCGVTIDHEVLCWGSDGFGQCSDVPEGMQFSMVTTGRKFSCGILANGTGTCWGQKISGYEGAP